MSLAAYDDYIAYTRQHFEEGLIRSGYVETDTGWQGPITHGGGTASIVITLPSRFPFRPPRVIPVETDEVPWSWHRELDGALCLVAEDDHEGLWWTETDAFLEHIKSWFENANLGWPDDRPDLDLDRYFQCSDDEQLYLYDDLSQRRNSYVRFRPSSNNTMKIGSGTRPVKTSKRSKDRFGYVANLGEVATPPHKWDDIAARIDPNVNIDRQIRAHAIGIVVLIYRRGAHDGAITLEVWPTTTGGIAVRRLRSAADTEAARSSRAGALAPQLNQSQLAIVGVGALGSFIADAAVRSGFRHLTLVDADVVMPGNLVRHLVGPEAIGRSKAQAVKSHLVARSEIHPDSINLIETALSTGAEAVDLLNEHDLVINATADFATTALLHVAAESIGTRILSAALQNTGATYRIDVLPPLDGATPQPSSTIAARSPSAEVFEAGCGSPISPTPPVAVIEAAAATVRHAIGLILKSPLNPAGEVRNIPVTAEGNQ